MLSLICLSFACFLHWLTRNTRHCLIKWEHLCRRLSAEMQLFLFHPIICLSLLHAGCQFSALHRQFVRASLVNETSTRLFNLNRERKAVKQQQQQISPNHTQATSVRIVYLVIIRRWEQTRWRPQTFLAPSIRWGSERTEHGAPAACAMRWEWHSCLRPPVSWRGLEASTSLSL